MNDPIIFAATQHEDRHETPDPHAPDEPNAQPLRTLLETAATCRPVEEVTALVSLLKEGGRLPDAGHDALRTAAVTRPVQDVRRMVTLLGEHPHEVVEADITLRAAAVGRSIEDVALLVAILGKDDPSAPEQQGHTGSAEIAGSSEPARSVKSVAPAGPAGPDEKPFEEPYEAQYEPPYAALYDAPYPKPPQRRRTAPGDGEAAGSPAVRHVLRWPAAFALLVSGALHLPDDLTALPSAAPVVYLPLLVTVLCLGIGILVALRDTTAVWRAGAATALGVVALHVLGGSAGFDPLEATVGGPPAWAGVTVVLSAVAAAVLAGLALRNRRESSA